MPLSTRRRIHQRRTRRLFLEPLERRELLTVLASIGVGTANHAKEGFLDGSGDGQVGFGRDPVSLEDADYIFTGSVTISYQVTGISSTSPTGIPTSPASATDRQIVNEGTITLGANNVRYDAVDVFPNDDDEDEGWESIQIEILSWQESDPDVDYRIGYIDFAGVLQGNTTILHIEDDDKESNVRPVEEDTISCDCICTCSSSSTGVNLNNGAAYASNSAAGLKYDSSALGNIVIQADMKFGTSYKYDGTKIEADYEFDGILVEERDYDGGGIEPNEWIRTAVPLALPGKSSGRYAAVINYDAPDPDEPKTISTYAKLRNNLDSEFGRGWIATGLDKLQIQADGVLWLKGDANAFFFQKLFSGAYLRQLGEPDASTLVEGPGGVFTLRKKTGETLAFTSQGILATRTDRSGNITTYSYADKDGDTIADEITQITDPAGRTTTYGYAGQFVSSITDFYGRVTTLEHDPFNRLTKIIEPDPDGAAGPLLAPETIYAYSFDQLTEVTDAEGQTTIFRYTSGVYPMVDQVIHPDGGIENITSVLAIAVANGGQILADGIKAKYRNEVDNEWELTLNKFGSALLIKDPYGNKTEFIVSDENRIDSRIDPPPGFGNLTPPVTTYGYDDYGNLESIGFPNGSDLIWTYEANFSQPTSFTDARGKQTVYTVDAGNGNIMSVRQVLGASDLQSSETDDVVTTFTYTPLTAAANDTPAGLIDLIVDPLGRVTDYDYVGRGLIDSITFADGTADQGMLTFSYDAFEDLAWSKDERNNRTDYKFDRLHRLIEVKLPNLGGVVGQPTYLYEYNKNNYLKKVTDPLNRVTQYTYTPRNDLHEVKQPDHDGVGGLTVTTFNYDDHRRLTSVVDPLGHTTVYGYDNLDRDATITLPDPDPSDNRPAPVWTTRYDDIGRVRQTEDPLGNLTDYAYTGFVTEVLITLSDPDGPLLSQPRPTIRQFLDAAGNVTDLIDERQGHTSYEYDDLGRLTKLTQPNPLTGADSGGPEWIYQYNKLGQLSHATDPEARLTSYEYDARARLITVREPDPDGAGFLDRPATTYTYDAASNLAAVIDPLGNLTEHYYDALNELTLTSEYRSQGPTSYTSYTYDAVGNLESLTDPVGNVTTWQYDDLDQPKKEITGLGDRTFKFDAVGNLRERIDRNLRKTIYEYDDLDQNTFEKWYSPQGALLHTLSFTYDDLGRLDLASDPLSAANDYEYDNLSRLKKDTQSLVGLGGLIEFNRQFDATGNVEILDASIGGAADFQNVYDYDYLQRLTTLTQQSQTVPGAHAVAGKQIDFAYDQTGLFKQIDRYADAAGTEYVASSHYQYDGMGRLSKLAHSTTTTPPPTGSSWGTGVLSGYQYFYDAASRLTNINLKIGNFTGGEGYIYDETDQLVTAMHGGPYTQPQENYTYDANGNRTTHTIGPHNQLLSDGTYDYTYDAEGNRTTKTHIGTGRMTTYEYDHRNRLTSATDWLVGPYPADDGAGTGWGVHPTSDSTTSMGDPDAGRYNAWDWGPSYASGSTGGGTIAFEATVTSAEEGNNVVLTLSASSSVQLEFWAVDQSAYFHGGDYYWDDFWNGTGTVTVSGSTPVIFTTGENGLYSPTKSFAIHVRAVGDPGSEIILEADIFSDDAMAVNATADPVEEGETLQLIVTAGTGFPGISGVTFEWWVQDVSAVWNDDYATSWTSGGGTLGEFTTDGYGNGYVDFTTLASPHIFELTESFKIHLRVKNDPNQSNIVTVEGRILDLDPMRYEDAGVTYKYDTVNQLVSRQFDLDGPSGPEPASQTYYAYDRGQIVLQFDGNTPADLSHRYTWGPQTDQLLADEQLLPLLLGEGRGEGDWDGEILWALADHLGTIRDIAVHDSVTDQTTVANHRTYDAFGNLVHETNAAVDLLFGYTGKLWDEATQLQNNLHRIYDPVTGRFMTVDPIGFNGDSGNLYRYVENGPTNATDPDGLEKRKPLHPHGSRTLGGKRLPAEKRVSDPSVDFCGTIIGVFYEPLDWIMTAEAIGEDPGDIWNWAGVIPGVPAGAGKLAKRLGKGADAAKAVDDATDIGKTVPAKRPGSKGHPDHQEKVKELVEELKERAGPGDEVRQERKIQGVDSNRRPDAQIVGPDGKTCEIAEAERRPNSKRNRDREAEYDRLGIPHTTHPVDPK